MSVAPEDCLAAVSAYVADAEASHRHPGLSGYERAAKANHWPSRTTISVHVGRWSEALAAVGFCPDVAAQARRRACTAALAAYVGEMAQDGRYPSSTGYAARAQAQGWPALQTLRSALGPWPDALRTVGVAVPDPRTGCKIGREACVAAVTRYVAEAAAQERYPGVHLYDRLSKRRGWPTRETVVSRVGSWAEALDAAGYATPRTLAHRVDRARCVEAVAEYLAHCERAGTAPTAAGYGAAARGHGWPARSTVSRRLGSWQLALAAVGAGSPSGPRPFAAIRPEM